MIRYTYNTEAAEVVAVECESIGYPNRDATGAVQYDNSHFDSWQDAHARLVAEIKAGIWLSSRALKDIREKTARYTQSLADDAERLVKAEALKP